MVFRGLRERVTERGELVDVLDRHLNPERDHEIDVYDLEDVFDGFAKVGTSAVILVDGWEIILRNQNYWGDFFHIVRSMGQRQPHGVAFVLGTPRRLLDLWADQMGSVYYNIFVTVTIGRMEQAEVQECVRQTLKTAGLSANLEAEEVVLVASDTHPYLVTLVTYLVTDQLKTNGVIESGGISAALRDPNGKVVELMRQIRAALSPTERAWLDKLHLATAPQKAALAQLRDYGLLPPGTKL